MQQLYRFLTIILMGIFCSTAYGTLKTSRIVFQSVPENNSFVTSDGKTWAITTDANSMDYDQTLGVCYRNVSSVHFRSTDYKGTILRVAINASGTNGPGLTTYYFSDETNIPYLTENPTDYVFSSYTQFLDYFAFEISKSNTQRISVKSIEVMYDDDITPVKNRIYEQVTDISQLKDNDEIIITKEKNSKAYLAMAMPYNGNSRTSTELTRNDDETFSGDDLSMMYCPILLEKAEGDDWYLRATKGYIYDKSGINQYTNNLEKVLGTAHNLESFGDNTDNARIRITFSEGKATIQFPLHTTTKFIKLFLNGSNFFICNDASSSLCIFRRVKQEPETISVTFKQEFGGWSSLYYKEKNLIVPDDFTAYAYTVTNGEGSTSTPYETGAVIPKDTPVLLKLKDEYAAYDEDGTRTVNVSITSQEGVTAEGNTLLGSEDGGTTTVDGNSEGYEFFCLSLNAKSEEGSIGFYWGADNGGPFTIGAHKAYLALPMLQSSPVSYIPLRIVPYLLGDANGDGVVNVADVMVVVNYILGKEPPIIKLKRSDVNSDQIVNVTDAMGIVNIIMNGGGKDKSNIENLHITYNGDY